MAWNIFNICIRSGIHLEVRWISRTMNQQADYMSHLIDIDDWQITNDLFLILDGRWEPHTIDWFANYYNHKIPRFFSRFLNPNTAGVDFFFQSLSGENCLVVPPVSIVPRVLHFMKLQYAVGTIIIPLWPSAHYWPFISHIYNKYLAAYSIHNGKEVLCHGRNPN